MMRWVRCVESFFVVLAIVVGISSVTTAAVHRWDIEEYYSNADGSIQFVELLNPTADGNEWFFKANDILLTLDDGTSQIAYAFDHDLDISVSTAHASALLATQGFADLGVVTPDWIIPDGFLLIGGATATLGAFELNTYMTLPTDGLMSRYADGSIGINSPTNFAGQSGVVPEPGTGLLVSVGLGLMAGFARVRA